MLESGTRNSFSHLVTFLLLICGLLLSCHLRANTSQVTLPKNIAITSHAHFIPVLGEQQFFSFNRNGDIYFIDPQSSLTEESNSEPSLSLKKSLNLNELELFSLALHPSFSLEGKPGNSTFYTAYKVPYDKQSATVRLAAQTQDNRFDIVISEWIFLQHSGKVAANSQREIFRIAGSDSAFDVKQLSFNPYIKPWQENYGLLHILLSQSGTSTQAIFSGGLLRIDPTPFGLKQYTVPMSNPFRQKNDILPELALYNIESPKSLFWQKNSHHDLLIHHINGNGGMISSVALGDNMNAIKSEYKFSVSDLELFNTMQYQRPNPSDASPMYIALDSHDNQLKQITFKDNAHQIEFAKLFEEQPNLMNLILVNLSDKVATFYAGANQSLHFMNYKDEGKNSDIKEDENNEPTETTLSVGPFFYLTIIILITLGIWLNRAKIIEENAKRKIRQQYAKVSIVDGEIYLFKRHQKGVYLKLSPSDIELSELFLNCNSVNQVDSQSLPFSNEAELHVKSLFNREYHLKMFGKRVRQVQLELTDKKGKKFLICPYFRIGDQRYTKLHFKPSLALLIDFQWQLSEIINPTNTPERKEEVIPDPAALMPAKNHLKPKSTPKPVAQSQQSNKSQSAKQLEPNTQVQDQKLASKISEIQDTKIIDALEKLVNLHQQGFLDDKEFASAKGKLLQSLVDQ